MAYVRVFLSTSPDLLMQYYGPAPRVSDSILCPSLGGALMVETVYWVVRKPGSHGPDGSLARCIECVEVFCRKL
jgi:hypothetical protein